VQYGGTNGNKQDTGRRNVSTVTVTPSEMVEYSNLAVNTRVMTLFPHSLQIQFLIHLAIYKFIFAY
jgi:hypothetical protein